MLAHFLLLMHYTQCEAWLLTLLLSRRSDGEGNVSDDKAGLSRISFCLCYKVSGLNEQHCQNNRGTLATPSVDH